MCYYSTTLRKDRVRYAVENEDLVLVVDDTGHHFPKGSDGKIVCMTGGEMHIAELWPSQMGCRAWPALAHLIGKPVDARFVERSIGGYAVDRIVIEGCELHLLNLAVGTKFYIGPKRLDVAEKLGVNDPSITLDHMPPDPKPGDEEQTPVQEPTPEPAPETPAPDKVTA